MSDFPELLQITRWLSSRCLVFCIFVFEHAAWNHQSQWFRLRFWWCHGDSFWLESCLWRFRLLISTKHFCQSRPKYSRMTMLEYAKKIIFSHVMSYISSRMLCHTYRHFCGRNSHLSPVKDSPVFTFLTFPRCNASSKPSMLAGQG